MSRVSFHTTTLQEDGVLTNTKMKVEKDLNTDNTHLLVDAMNLEMMRRKFWTPKQSISSEGLVGNQIREAGIKESMKYNGTEQKGSRPSALRRQHSNENSSMPWITQAKELKDSRSENSTVSQERTAAAIKSCFRDVPQLDAQTRRIRVPRRYRDRRDSSQHNSRDTAQHSPSPVSSAQRPRVKFQQGPSNQKEIPRAKDKVKVKNILKEKSERRMRPLPVIQELDDASKVQKEITTKLAKVNKHRDLSFMNCVQDSLIQTFDFFVGSFDNDSLSEDEYSDF